MVEQSGSFASPVGLVCSETARVNFGRESNTRPAVAPRYASVSGCWCINSGQSGRRRTDLHM